MPEQLRYVVEVAGDAAGLIVQDGRQFRFFASSPLYMHLDRAHFGSPAQAERACRRARIGLAAYTRGSPDLDDLRALAQAPETAGPDLALSAVGG